MLYYRNSARSGSVSLAGRSYKIALTDDTSIVLVPFDADGTQRDMLTVNLTNGTTLQSPVQWQPDVPYGHATIDSPRSAIQTAEAG